MAALLALGLIGPADAVAMGGITASAGVIAAGAVMLLVGAWPEKMSAGAVSGLIGLALTTFALLGGMIGALALWRYRSARVSRFGAMAGSALKGSVRQLAAANTRTRTRAAPAVDLPAGLDPAMLQAELESHFIRLQTAWDNGDLPALRTLTTHDMLGELCAGRAGCLDHPGNEPAAAPARTSVVSLHMQLLGFESRAGRWLVSAEFSGWTRESAEGAASPFREVWMLVAQQSGVRAWQLGRHHALL